MTKIKESVETHEKQCDKCGLEPVQFDSFKHNDRYYCGGCLQGILSPEMTKISIDSWAKVGSNGYAF